MGWRLVTVAVALAGYAAFSTALMARAPGAALSLAALFGPLVAALAVGGMLRRHAPTLAAAAAGAAALGWLLLYRERVDVRDLYVLQHAAIHAVLGWTFAATLRPGATPLITLLAERVHTRFTPAMRAYTRAVTQAWVVYFAAVIAVSLALYATVPWSWWSLWCNVGTPLALIAMFVGEYLLRYRLHPDFERATLADAVRAYRGHGR